MKITILGTGTSQGVPVIGCDCEACLSDNPKDNRLRTSALLTHNNTNILIDAGPDLRQQLLRCRLHTLDAVLITHEHNDHIIGLDELRPFNFRQGAKMPIYTSARVAKSIIERFSYAFAKNPYPGAPQLEIVEVTPNIPFKIKGITIIPYEIMHGDLPILCFKVQDFIYITDAKYVDDTVVENIKGAKLLIVNALHHNQHHSHFNLSEALEFIQQVQPSHAYLTHLSHNIGKAEDVKAMLPHNVSLAHDGLVLDLT
ncbi:MAG: MBL fold metallo-hydrolase [Saprospiraceae bacterium]|nr:MBL fold metallo-hydrolase [Saprospiraceae bacterium]